MRAACYLIVAWVLSMCSQVRASVEVSNPRIILPASRIIQPRRRTAFNARLSPDGRYILFPKLADPAKRLHRLVLLDAVSKEESVIPIDLPQGYETVFTRFNFFNPSGDKIALFSIKQHPSPGTAEVVVFDISSAKLIRTNISGPSVMGQFDYTGKRLLVSMSNSYVAFASLDDLTVGKPLAQGWTHSCSPYSPYATVFVPPGRAESQSGLMLVDLKDNNTSQLPVHERNSRLDDATCQWNLDGRYVFYFDIVQKGQRSFDPITRVWDVLASAEKAAIRNAVCIGPGPASHLMVMTSMKEDPANRILIYDLNSGKLSPIGPPSARPIHAWKDYVLYVAPDKEDKENIYIAEINEVRD